MSESGRILVVTSCTGEKSVRSDDALTLEDFQKGSAHVEQREGELSELLTPAEDLYSGQQHVRLMRGVRRYREGVSASGSAKPELDLWILSAGYGLVPADRELAPYEGTFQGMKKRELRSWADDLDIPGQIRSLLAQPCDLGLILLGDTYLEACALDNSVQLGGPTILFCGSKMESRLPKLPDLHPVILSNREAKRFSCGLVGLKGEVAGRLLERLGSDPDFLGQLKDPGMDVLGGLGETYEKKPKAASRPKAHPNPSVDKVIDIPESWRRKPHRKKLRYFIPDWDDLVDPDYDFETDTHSGGTGDWSNQVYAHQLYPEPNYDGILVSKVVAEKSKKKKELINEVGVHRYLRVPSEFPIMGDCGAFGYIQEETPPYSTDEILDYYTRLGFNYGVSIDHLVVASSEAQKKERYELTINNAEEFLSEHRNRDLPWEPIGAIQGWDPPSYAKAARQYVNMGYRYIALGGLVRDQTVDILRVLEEVRKVVPADVKIHLFGLARFNALSDFARLGVHSIDSASVLRKAWLGSDSNFLTLDGWYSAIRVPQWDKSFRAKRLVKEGRRSPEQLQQLERSCLAGLREYEQTGGSLPSSLIDVLTEYDVLLAGERKNVREKISRTLEDKPWEKCGCAICSRWGIEVAIFRGNNRNRRRGFHNTHVFYKLLDRLANSVDNSWLSTSTDKNNSVDQPALFIGSSG